MSLLRDLVASFADTDRRRYKRIADRPLMLKIDSRKYRTLDWSPGGFRIKDYHQPLKPGDRLEGKVVKIGAARAGDFMAQVVWVNGDGEVGLQVLEIAPTTLYEMAYFYRQR